MSQEFRWLEFRKRTCEDLLRKFIVVLNQSRQEETFNSDSAKEELHHIQMDYCNQFAKRDDMDPIRESFIDQRVIQLARNELNPLLMQDEALVANHGVIQTTTINSQSSLLDEKVGAYRQTFGS